MRHPFQIGEAEVTAFLTHLARDEAVDPSTQNYALSALLFVNQGLLQRRIGWMAGLQRGDSRCDR